MWTDMKIAYQSARILLASYVIILLSSIAFADDVTPPAVEIINLADGSEVSDIVQIHVKVNDEIGVYQAVLYVDEAKVDEKNVEQGQFSALVIGLAKTYPKEKEFVFTWDTTKNTNGNHAVKVVGYDNSSNQGVAQVGVNVQNIDITSPLISSVEAGEIATSSALVSWYTDENADSQVEYGPSPSYGSQTDASLSLSKSHSHILSDLSPGTTYYYRVKSKDASGNLVVSNTYTFTTSDRAACQTDVKQCADGIYVPRDLNNNCEFKSCPTVHTDESSIQIPLATPVEAIPTEVSSPSAVGTIESIQNFYINIDANGIKQSTGFAGSAVSKVNITEVSDKIAKAFIATGSSLASVTIEKSGAFVKIDSNNIKAITKDSVKIRPDGLFLRNVDPKSEIKFLPDYAQKVAEQFGVDVASMELINKDDIPVYKVQGHLEKKIFGLVTVRMNQETEINANNGDVVKIQKPWWHIFAK